MPDCSPSPGGSVHPPAAGGGVSDSSLVRQFQAGSGTAAGWLYRRYATRLRGLARAKASAALGNRLDADDIVQSVFRRFFATASEAEFEVPAGADLWNLLLVITLNKVRAEEEFHRAARRDVRRTRGEEDLVSPLAAVASRDDAATAFLRLAVAEALQRLPGDRRRAVEFRMQGYEVAEIADRLGRSKRTVERLLQEAHAQLTEILGEDERP